MEPALALIVAGALGWLAGFLTSVPGGPVNATLLAEVGRRGLRWGLFVGLGAIFMEAGYCALAFASFARFFESRWLKAAMELASFLLMLWLGIKYLRGQHLPGEERLEHFVEQRFHPHTAFWIGFLRILGNPGVLLLWITVAATLLSREWLADTWPAKWSFIAGVALGGLCWFSLVAWGVAHGSRRFSPQGVRNFSRLSGFFLLAVAALVGYRLIALLARAH
ncbi:MAG: LysE family translocator [Verrucomicrobiota bacterium]